MGDPAAGGGKGSIDAVHQNLLERLHRLVESDQFRPAAFGPGRLETAAGLGAGGVEQAGRTLGGQHRAQAVRPVLCRDVIDLGPGRFEHGAEAGEPSVAMGRWCPARDARGGIGRQTAGRPQAAKNALSGGLGLIHRGIPFLSPACGGSWPRIWAYCDCGSIGSAPAARPGRDCRTSPSGGNSPHRDGAR